MDIFPHLTLVEQIGTGGMSTVWKAWDAERNAHVAVKVLNDECAANVTDLAAFEEEERLMAEIRHPGIVRAYGFNHANGYWYITMELVDGYTFADLLRRKQHVSEADCLLICESVAAALDYAWNDHGLIHCDIKPENIMINTDGVVKLTDLGISSRFQFRDGEAKEVPDHVTGTPAYISPEQVYGDVVLDCRTDIYSLGATLYHLATGRVLFPNFDNDQTLRAHCDATAQARDPRLYRKELSEGFAQLLEVMLVKDRNGRLSTWSDVAALCREVEGGTKFKRRDTSDPSSLKLIDPANRTFA